MKVIKSKLEFPPKSEFPIIRTCPICEAKLEIEKDDIVKTFFNDRPFEVVLAHVQEYLGLFPAVEY